MEHEAVDHLEGMEYRTHRFTRSGRVKYETVVRPEPAESYEDEVGYFEIEGPQGEDGLGFEEGPGIQPMNMTISIEEAFRGRGISRHLVHYTCDYIRKSLSGLDLDLANKLVFIDTDASGGFWANLGMLSTDDIRTGREMPQMAGTKRKRDRSAGMKGWLTETQAALIRADYGEGYEGVISFGALCAWANPLPANPSQGRSTKKARTLWGGRSRRKGESGRTRGSSRGRKRPCRTRSTKTIRRSRGGRRKARR